MNNNDTERYIYPEGYYRVKVIGQALTPSKTTGDLYLLLKVEVLEKTDKNKEEITPGYHRYVRLFFSDQAQEKTLDILAAAGFDVRNNHDLDFAQLQNEHADHVSLNGFEFSAKCKHEEYNGENRDSFQPSFKWQISAPNSWMTNSLQRANRDQITSLNAMFGAGKRPYNRAASAVPF